MRHELVITQSITDFNVNYILCPIITIQFQCLLVLKKIIINIKYKQAYDKANKSYI